MTNVLRKEVNAVTLLLKKYPDLRSLFDDPAATVPQRKACFTMLAHRKIMDIIYETFTQLRKESPSLGDEESNVISATQSLVAGDAPAWVREVSEVVELLPTRLFAVLPEPLRTGAFYAKDSAQLEAIESAAMALSSVEQIQALIGGVLEQQLQRLRQRWPAPKKKGRRKRDNQRIIRDNLIAEIDDVAETPGEFLRLMDERKVKPQPTWNEWPGSWVQAYKNPRLRGLIHKDKSRALSRGHVGHSG
ncbi:MAG TPA: hypothetical protein VNE63_12035 [Candidatus Acidoferrales bacterium]|nr:hypothetical protein [Candidatus Acidoferrales bacterium]